MHTTANTILVERRFQSMLPNVEVKYEAVRCVRDSNFANRVFLFFLTDTYMLLDLAKATSRFGKSSKLAEAGIFHQLCRIRRRRQ